MLAVRRTQRDRLTLSTYIDLEELLVSTIEIHEVARGDEQQAGHLPAFIIKTDDREPTTENPKAKNRRPKAENPMHPVFVHLLADERAKTLRRSANASRRFRRLWE